MSHASADNQEWHANQRVRVRRGPFRDFVGKVASVDAVARSVQVELSFYNRPVKVELTFADIEQVSGRRGGSTDH